MELLSYMRLFVEVARTKSFRGAAEALVDSTTAASKLSNFPPMTDSFSVRTQ